MHDDRKGMRKAASDKAKRLTSADPHQKVDASSWTPPEPIDADVKTGLRPISPRQFKRGGKVAHMEGAKAHHHAGRKMRKSGGRALTADSLINRNVKEANEQREGKKHVGAMKRGGMAGHPDVAEDKALIKSMIKPSALRGKKARGGAEADFAKRNEGKDEIGQMLSNMSANPPMESSKAKADVVPMPKAVPGRPKVTAEKLPPGFVGHKDGGKIKWIQGAIKHKGALHKALHVPAGENIPAKKLEKAAHSDNPHVAKMANLAKTLKRMPHADGGHADHDEDCRCKKCWGGAAEIKGDRVARKSGGRAKGAKTHINIMIAPHSKDDRMGPPMPPPAMARPIPTPAPAPMGAGQMGGMPLPPTSAMPMRPPMGGMPMGRKNGGRTIHVIDHAAGGGLGRLEKIKAYGHKARGS